MEKEFDKNEEGVKGTKKPCGNNDLCKFAQLLIAKNKMVRAETAI